MLFAREILRERPGATFVSEVKCSQAMYDEIARLGGRAIMWKVGHSLIKTKMREEKAVLAGEMSGHMFFADRYYGYDDAVYASARLVELLTRSERPLSALVDGLPVMHNTPEIRLPCPDDIKFEVVRRALAHYRRDHHVVDVDGARVSFPGGWAWCAPPTPARCWCFAAKPTAPSAWPKSAPIWRVGCTPSPPRCNPKHKPPKHCRLAGNPIVRISSGREPCKESLLVRHGSANCCRLLHFSPCFSARGPHRQPWEETWHRSPLTRLSWRPA